MSIVALICIHNTLAPLFSFLMPPYSEIAGGCAEFPIRYSIPTRLRVIVHKIKQHKIMFRHFGLCFGGPSSRVRSVKDAESPGGTLRRRALHEK